MPRNLDHRVEVLAPVEGGRTRQELNAILDSGSHWLDRPIVPNCLRDPAVMYGGV